MLNEDNIKETEKTEEQTTEIIPIDNINPIQAELNDIVKDIEKVNNKAELEQLYQKFNINNTKKNVVRISELNDMLDMVNKQAADRFKCRPHEMSNKEVLDYMNAIQNQLERSQKVVDSIKDIPNVQINSQTNNISINIDTKETIEKLDRNSREKISYAISKILQQSINKSEDQSNLEPLDITDTANIETVENVDDNIKDVVSDNMIDFLDDLDEGDE